MSKAYKRRRDERVDWPHRRDVLKSEMEPGVAYRATDLGRSTGISASMVGYALRRDPGIQVITDDGAARFIKRPEP